MKSANWLHLMMLWLIAPHALALNTYMPELGFDRDFEEKPWSEVEVQLPVFPEKENLIAFRVGAVTDPLFYIDGKSISVGSDGVIRYTLVVVSSLGARNISYEGMRCATYERRLYAFGRSDKTWSKARGNNWVRIQGTSSNHHVELFSNNFCPNTMVAPSPDEVRRVLQQGGVVR